MRNKIVGVVGILLGLFLCVGTLLTGGQGSSFLVGLIMIGLSIHQMLKLPKALEDKPDIDPADRVRNMDEPKSD